jgi:hypothetical protein
MSTWQTSFNPVLLNGLRGKFNSLVAEVTELEFLKSLWGLGTEEEEGYRTGPPGYIGWRNSLLGNDSGAPYTFKNTGSVKWMARRKTLQTIVLITSKNSASVNISEKFYQIREIFYLDMAKWLPWVLTTCPAMLPVSAPGYRNGQFSSQ